MQLANSTRLGPGEAQRLFREVLNYPLFVPDLGTHVTRLLIEGDLPGFLKELHRLALLGSRPASALLACLYLKGAVHGTPDPARAEQLCADAACKGEPYAQYVMGWICRMTGRDAEAMKWLRRSGVKGLFLPAIVDIGRFIAEGFGVEAPDARMALSVLWEAHRLGHRMALAYISGILLAGAVGWLGKLVGAALSPLAVMRAATYAHRNPLSDRAFVIRTSMTRPLFKIGCY